MAHGQNDGTEATLFWKLHPAPPAGRKGALGGQQTNMLAGTEGFRDMDQGMQGQGVRDVGTRAEGGKVNTEIQLGMQKHRPGAQDTGWGDVEDAGTQLGDTPPAWGHSCPSASCVSNSRLVSDCCKGSTLSEAGRSLLAEF